MRTGSGPTGWKAGIAHLRGFERPDHRDRGRRRERGHGRGAGGQPCEAHRGNCSASPGTGREVEFRAADFHRVVDGLIVRTWHLEDHFAIASQIGLEFNRGS
ncbi:ester cyclase [Streptomyces sp. NPDC059134]|uniref:ester cyclase n=1 Tax=Streptomyces sp. NPDC059134 TaxID=3346738 RepID=UPI0036ACB16E